MTTLTINLPHSKYDINIGSGLLDRIDEFFNLDRRVFIITDSGVPREYAETVKKKAGLGYVCTLPAGEGTKSIACFETALSQMVELGFSRGDCVVSVGGGVVGDLGGYVASSYMRGVDFYNVPTTTLSQLDSSIGGKVAINLNGVKNIVGAFYQPKGVLIDTRTLKTLDERQYASGLCEAIKMAMTSNAELFAFFEKNAVNESNLEYVISEALKIKKSVVEKDEKETSLRKILNFGHTYGHAIESITGMEKLYHGECVSLGMIPMCSEEARKRLLPVLNKFGLPTSFTPDFEEIYRVMAHDKKASGGFIDAIFVEKIGEYKIEKISVEALTKMIKEIVLTKGDF